MERNANPKENNKADDGSASRRSSRLSTKKRSNYSEDTENFNLYLLLELINMEADQPLKGNKRKASKAVRSTSKRVKISEEKEETKSRKKQTSNVFSNNSFGGEKSKPISKLQNKDLDKILKGDTPLSGDDDSDKDSLDLNIGKKVKMNTKNGNVTLRPEEKQLSSVSFLQDARNISKTSSFNQMQKIPSLIKMNSNLHNANYDYNFAGIIGRNFSDTLNKFNASPFTRNKTKVYNFDTSVRFGREESDPAFRQSIFNEQNQFKTADHYFDFNSNPWAGIQRQNTSNPLNITVVREISAPKSPKFASNSQMPRLKTENLSPSIGAPSRTSSTPFVSNSHTASFGQKNLRSGKTISQPVVRRKEKSATPPRSGGRRSRRGSSISRSRSIPMGLATQKDGAFTKYKK